MPDVPPYRFSISEFTTQPWTFEQDVEHYAALGVEMIEVCEVKLDQDRIDEQLALIPQHGLAISSIQPVVRTLYPSQSQPEPKEIPARMARYRRTIESFGEYGRNAPFITNTGNPPDGNIQQLLDTAVEQYRDLADFAADRGARVAFEPLNPTIVNVETAIWTLQQGTELVETVDRPNFGLCLDYWNVWQSPDIEAAIRAAGDRIFIVQASDWRTPRSFEDRLIPGDGAIPLPPLLRATREARYDGPYEVEIFSGHVPDSLWAGNLDDVIRRSRAGLDRAWEESFA